jgi:hypothetical protein
MLIETKSRTRAEKTYRTQQLTQHLVAAELYRLGYNVTFTSGNSPLADLVVSTPDGAKTFFVDVKGQSDKSSWFIERRPTNPNLFYICVVYGKPTADTHSKDLFFVLTHEQELALCAAREKQKRQLKHQGAHLGGFPYAPILPYQDKWSVLPMDSEPSPSRASG